MVAVKSNTTHQIFKIIFDSWCINNNISNKRVSAIIYAEKNPAFLTLDDWKTSTKDDFYKEYESSFSIDTELLEELSEKQWMEELGEDGLKELQYNIHDIYEESSSVFNRCLSKVVKKIEDAEYER